MLITRCTKEMAMAMRRVLNHSYFCFRDPEIEKLKERGWVEDDNIWQYRLTRKGTGRYAKWLEAKKENYRHIALSNAIYTSGPIGYGSAYYFAYPTLFKQDSHRRPGDQVILDSFVIGEMIRNGELAFCEEDRYWYAEYKKDPKNRVFTISSCDLPF